MDDRDPPDFRKRIRESFARQAAMCTIGAELTLVEQGTVEIELPFDEKLTQQHGFLHAGIVTTLVDSACGYAALSVMEPGAAVLSVEYKVNLLAPAIGDKLICRSEVIKAGQRQAVSRADVFAVRDGQEKIIATGLATIARV